MESTRTGIEVVGEVAWGTHLCHFYETRQDLLDILIPYFRAGLEAREFCVWVVAEFTLEEAQDALGRGIPGAEHHLSAGDIQIIPHAEWYLHGSTFDAERVTGDWCSKLDEALAKGYAGLRGGGVVAGLLEKYGEDVLRFEEGLDEALAGRRVILLCSYLLSKVDAAAVFDVVRTHEVAIVRRRGRWEVLESAELKRVKREIEKLNAELEQRVAVRTRELEAANEELKKEVARRERVEAALRESEERFRRAFVSNPAANAICSFPDGRILYVNDAFVRTFGYAPEEAVGKTSVELGLWPDPGEREELVRMARGGELLRRYEARLRSKSGDLVDALIYTEMIELAGAPHLLVMVSDITERKRAEELLRTRERHFRTIIENSADGIALFSPDGSIQYASPSTPRVLGYTPEELVSFNAFDLVHPEDHEAVRQGINAILGRPAASADVQMRVRHKDGEWRWLEGAFTNMIDEPHVGAIVNNFRDITGRKRAEDENRRLVSVLGERVKELTALHNAARVLQQEQVDTASVLRELAELLPPAFQYPEITAARVRLGGIEAATAGFASSPSALRADCMTANGQPCSIEVVYTAERPHAAEGPFLAEERRLINTLADMLRAAYDRRQAEAQLRQTTEQLRALSASLRSAREEEAARIAREIHDELGAALSSLRWDLEEVGEVVSEAADAPRLAALRRKIADMMGLTDAAVNTVRRIASELRPVALDDLGLAEAIEWQAGQFQARTGIVVMCDCQLENVELRREQSTAVFRIFQEALTNVLRHARATRVDVALKREFGRLTLTVSDNGRGITEEERTGAQTLGLLGMRERANLAGGELVITGDEGKGTTITVRVPVNG
jgi:PAS domain S-box-containing protein